MHSDLVDLLACPDCHAFPLELHIIFMDRDEVIEGTLHCSACRRKYIIEQGIPTMLRNSQSRNSPPLGQQSLDTDAPKENTWLYSEEEYWDKIYAKLKRLPGHIKELRVPILREIDYVNLDRLVTREQFMFNPIRQEIAGQVLIEIGAGDCGNIRRMCDPTSYSYRYIGTDISREGLLRGREIVRGDFIQCAVEAMPFRANCCHVLLSIGVLHHTASKENAIKSLAGLVQPGGLIALHEPFPRPSFLPNILRRIIFHWESPHEERLTSREDFLKECNSVGRVEFFQEEYTPFRTFCLLVFRSLLNRSMKATMSMLWFDDLLIRTLGKASPYFTGLSAFVLVRRKSSLSSTMG